MHSSMNVNSNEPYFGVQFLPRDVRDTTCRHNPYLLSHFCTWAFVQAARQSEQSADSVVLCYQLNIATKRHAQVSIHAKVYLLFRKGLGNSLFCLWHSSSSPRIIWIRLERKKELHQVIRYTSKKYWPCCDYLYVAVLSWLHFRIMSSECCVEGGYQIDS